MSDSLPVPDALVLLKTVWDQDAALAAVLALHQRQTLRSMVGTGEPGNPHDLGCYDCSAGAPLLKETTQPSLLDPAVLVPVHVHQGHPGSSWCTTCTDPDGVRDEPAAWPCPTALAANPALTDPATGHGGGPMPDTLTPDLEVEVEVDQALAAAVDAALALVCESTTQQGERPPVAVVAVTLACPGCSDGCVVLLCRSCWSSIRRARFVICRLCGAERAPACWVVTVEALGGGP